MTRRRFTLGRRLIVQVVGIIIVASIITFLAVHVLPGDPARQILGRTASAAAVAAKERALGLDRPLIVQYLSWLGDLIRGSLGTSLVSQRSVASALAGTIPVTILLVVLALVAATIGGIGLGILAVRNPGGWVDRGVTVYSALMSALPAFVWGLALVLLLSLTFQLLPPIGFVNPFTDPLQGLRTIVMPVIALALPCMGVITRITRVTLLESLRAPSVDFARSKGISNSRVLIVHALKNSAVPISAIIGTEFAYTLGDAVAVESIFAIPGVGQLLLNSFLQRDYPIIQGAVVVLTVIVVLITLVTDLTAAGFDPRIRDQALAVKA
jgi:peptide/nickel transport system permease protein